MNYFYFLDNSNINNLSKSLIDFVLSVIYLLFF
jgi:hypothetical protein